MSQPSVSIVIPAYNEEAIIEQVAKEAICALQRMAPASFEVVLVDDGSTDGTGFRMEQMRKKLQCVRVVSHERNRGLGAALKTGFGAATGGILTWIPGDGQFDVNEILKGLPLLAECDIVLVLRQGRKEVSRGVITFCFRALTRILFRFDATNLCGIYLLSRELLTALAPRAESVFYNLEVPLLCTKHKKRIRRVTTNILPRRAGLSKVTNVRTITATFWEMLKYRMGA
jgi:dolichol-phosphate mannosyltransferase